MNEHTAPELIEQDIEQTRAGISRTLDALQHRLSPEAWIENTLRSERVTHALKSVGSSGATFASNLGRIAAEHPLPLVLTGVGLTWLAVSSSRPHRGNGHESRRLDLHPQEIISDSAEASGMHDVERMDMSSIVSHAGDSGDFPLSEESTVMERTRETASQGAEKLKEAASDGVEHAKDTASYGAEKLKEAASDGVERAKETASHGAEKLKEAASDGVERAKETASHGTEKLKEATSDGVERAKETAAYGAEKVKETASHSVEKVKSIVTDARERASDLGERAAEGAKKATHAISSRVERASEAAKHTGAAAYEHTKGAAQKVTHAVREAPARLGDAAHSVGGFVQENPVLSGAIAAALGAGLALMIPSSRRESEILGEASDGVKTTVRDTLDEQVDRAKSVVRTMAGAAADAARREVGSDDQDAAVADDAAEEDVASAGADRLQPSRVRAVRTSPLATEPAADMTAGR